MKKSTMLFAILFLVFGIFILVHSTDNIEFKAAFIQVSIVIGLCIVIQDK